MKSTFVHIVLTITFLVCQSRGCSNVSPLAEDSFDSNKHYGSTPEGSGFDVPSTIPSAIATDKKWNKNYPPYHWLHYIASYKRTRQDKLSMLLLVGGLRDGLRCNDTWIYAPWSNSWLQISSSDQPLTPTHADGHQVLPTVCDTYVVLINQCGDVWYFNGWTRKWTKVDLKSPSSVFLSVPIKGAVSLRHPTNNSFDWSCRESVFLYGVGSVSKNMLHLYELICKELPEHLLHCEWRIDSVHEMIKNTYKTLMDYNKNVQIQSGGMMSVADKDRGMIYFSTRCSPLEYVDVSRNITIVFKYDWRRRILSNLVFNLSEKVCFHNIFMWNNSHLMLSDTKFLFAVSLKNHTRHALLKVSRTSRHDVMLTVDPLTVARIHWFHKPGQFPTDPYVFLHSFKSYYEKEFPSFRTKQQAFPPRGDPGSLFQHTSVYDYDSQTFYLYGGKRYDCGMPSEYFLTRILWKMKVSSKTWWEIKPLTTPNTYLSNCGTYNQFNVVIFGGRHKNGTVVNELWLFNTKHRTWNQIKFSSHSHPLPTPRAECSLTTASSLTSSPIILFGGYSTGGTVESDVWLLEQSTNGTDFKWSVASSETAKRKPPPRFGHSAVMIGNELIIYGGKANLSENTTKVCYFDMWAFSISNRTWRQVYALSRYHLLPAKSLRMYPCSSVLVPYGVSRIVVRDNIVYQNTTKSVSPVWTIDVLSQTPTDTILLDKPFVSLAGGIWNGSVVYYGTTVGSYNGSLLTIGAQCKEGAAQMDGPAGLCVTCPIRQYSANTRGVVECLECPRGTTTEKQGRTSVKNCTCDVNYCRHGRCEVTVTGDAVCICPFIFVGNRCSNINYFLFLFILGGLTICGVVAIALVCCGVRTIRHRRSKRRTEKELAETRKAFTILRQEIELQGRLDEDCPGGYGQVHKARYRDWTVAVKQLQLVMAEWADIRRDFLREIQFMRTVRHPNIVMFIGAGQYGEEQPFLVLEFMSGGALRSLLQNDDVQLTIRDQLQFILDTAEGMKYLHTLDPPRIHRDLKSANLLLSKRKQVKVCDFGSARLIPSVNRNKTDKSTDSKQVDPSQLLSSKSHLTQRFIGTCRWRSPELWRKEIYGTATDVYSFAIVVWEILTRQTPFSGDEYKFDSMVEDAVLSGTRPKLRAKTDKDLRHLMTQCWQEKPEDRPTFVDIVPKVQAMVRSSQLTKKKAIGNFHQHSLMGDRSGSCEMNDLDATRPVLEAKNVAFMLGDTSVYLI